MRKLSLLFLSCSLTGCIGVTPPVKNHFSLTAFSTYQLHQKKQLPSIYISIPESVANLETQDMFYTKIPYTTNAFVHNDWSAAPSTMLYPLIVQSIESTKAFHVVGAGTHSESFHYRLNTEIIKLEQNFLVKPSRLEMIVSAVVTDSNNIKPIASKLFEYHIACPSDTPYGGAIAANRATKQFTHDLSRFTVTEVSRHNASMK